MDIRYNNQDISLAMDAVPRLQRSSRRGSDYSNMSTDTFRVSQ
jgi:hypothetical protein